jgi:uncharacterized membrane protein YkgB
MKKIICIFIVFLVVANCKKENNSLKEFMANSWETTYLKIEMPTVNKTDSLQIYEDKFENNPNVIAQSKYNSDGTFSAWFINRKKEKQNESSGTWSIKNDSLHISYFYGGRNIAVSYAIRPNENGFIGTSKHDWDNDGEFDDLLTMKTKVISEK